MIYPDQLINQIVCTDSTQAIHHIPDLELDGIVIDPPYGQNMGYDGDDNLLRSCNIIRGIFKECRK